MEIKEKIYSIYSSFSLSEKHLFKGTVWNIFGNGLGKLMMLVLSIFIAKFLGAELFGKWGVIRSTSAIFTILLGFGIGVTAVRYVAEFKDTDKKKSGNILGIALSFAAIFGLLLTILFYFLSYTIAVNVIKDISILIPLRISSIFLILIAFNGVLSGALAGFNNFKAIASSNLISGILASPIILILCVNFHLNGLVIGYVSYYFIIFISLLFFFKSSLKKNQIKITLNGYKNNISIIFNHNVPAILSGGIGGIVIWIINAYVARLNFGFSILGINNAAKIIQNSMMELSAQLDVPMISYLSSSPDSNRKNKLNLYSPIVLATLIVLPFIYFPDLITWMFSDGDYSKSNFPLIVSLTMITTFLMVYKRGLGRAIITKNMLWLGVYENLFWGALILLFIVFLVPLYGSVGFALAFAISYLIDVIVITPIYYKKKLINFKLAYSKEIIVWWILSLLGVLTVYLDLDLVFRVIIFVIVFPIQIYIVKKLGNILNYN